MRSVVLVCGPPCAGKSAYVNRHRQPGDRVADFDQIARGLGSPVEWMHPQAIGDAADREMDRLIDEIGVSEAGTAWVVRCAADPVERGLLANRLRATRIVLLLPPLGVLLDRARLRPAARQTQQAVMRWKDHYAPYAADELIRA